MDHILGVFCQRGGKRKKRGAPYCFGYIEKCSFLKAKMQNKFELQARRKCLNRKTSTTKISFQTAS